LYFEYYILDQLIDAADGVIIHGAVDGGRKRRGGKGRRRWGADVLCWSAGAWSTT
jgi:hypothetical protein